MGWEAGYSEFFKVGTISYFINIFIPSNTNYILMKYTMKSYHQSFFPKNRVKFLIKLLSGRIFDETFTKTKIEVERIFRKKNFVIFSMVKSFL